MSKIEEPLEKGWLGNVMRDVRNEVATWPANSSYPKPDRNESCSEDPAESMPGAPIRNMQ
jgi:hypothetical protein